MELQPPSTTEVYTTFQDLHVAVNIHASKEGYAITTKRSKKNKKVELRKMCMQCDKDGVFKAKRFRKKETATRGDECLFMIIATRDNKIESWFLIITDAIHNHPPTLPGAHLIHWWFARTDKVIELIVSPTRIGASSKQVIAAIRSGTDEENPLVKPKDVYNEHSTQRQKQPGPLTQVQALMVEIHKKDDWYTYCIEDDEDRIEQNNCFLQRRSLKKLSSTIMRFY